MVFNPFHFAPRGMLTWQTWDWGSPSSWAATTTLSLLGSMGRTSARSSRVGPMPIMPSLLTSPGQTNSAPLHSSNGSSLRLRGGSRTGSWQSSAKSICPSCGTLNTLCCRILSILSSWRNSPLRECDPNRDAIRQKIFWLILILTGHKYCIFL